MHFLLPQLTLISLIDTAVLLLLLLVLPFCRVIGDDARTLTTSYVQSIPPNLETGTFATLYLLGQIIPAI